jgi:hypothetical protein
MYVHRNYCCRGKITYLSECVCVCVCVSVFTCVHVGVRAHGSVHARARVYPCLSSLQRVCAIL